MSDASAIRALIADLTPGDLTSLIAIFSYQGFNPEMVMKHLSEVKKSKAISDENFKKDMTALICLGCITGNYTGKNKDKRDEKGTAKADELFALYGLKMGSVGTDKRAITLPRILLTFPIMTHKVMMQCPERNFSGPFSSSQLPQVMKNAVFPALIPTDLKVSLKIALLNAYCGYTCDQTKAINEKVKGQSPQELFSTQYAYVDVGHKSPEPTDAERKKYFLGFRDALGANWAGVIVVLTKYKELVNQSYVIPAQFGTITPVSSAPPPPPTQSDPDFE